MNQRIQVFHPQMKGLLGRLRQARGLWAHRDDLPDWRELRQELDRACS